VERALKGLETQHEIIPSLLRGIADVTNTPLIIRPISLDSEIRLEMYDQRKIGWK